MRFTNVSTTTIDRSAKQTWRPKTYWCVRAKRRVAGWVAGGCWDDDMTNVMTWIIPDNSLRLAPHRTSGRRHPNEDTEPRVGHRVFARNRCIDWSAAVLSSANWMGNQGAANSLVPWKSPGLWKWAMEMEFIWKNYGNYNKPLIWKWSCTIFISWKWAKKLQFPPIIAI